MSRRRSGSDLAPREELHLAAWITPALAQQGGKGRCDRGGKLWFCGKVFVDTKINPA